MRIIISLFMILLNSQLITASVTALKAEFRKGKTYITWQEDADKTKKYNVYHSNSLISDVSELSKIATVSCSSSYDVRYNHFHVIEDFGTPLTIGTGLFVNTPKSNGNHYYAITTVSSNTEDKTIVIGSNSLQNPVAESYWQWPGAIIVSADSGYSYNFLMYYWMDYSDWMHGRDYYGDFFKLCKHNSVKNSAVPIPLSVGLHGSSNNSGWQLPSASCQTGFYKIVLRDHGIPDQTYWYGLSNHYGEHALRVGDTIVNYTEMRILNYIMSIAKNPEYNVDTNRLYIGGSSMGGGGTFMTSFHNPGVFAAISPALALVEYGYWGEDQFLAKFGTRTLGLTARNGENIWDHTSIPYLLRKYPNADFPAVVSGIGSKDPKMSMRLYRWLYKVFAETHHGIWGAWGNFGHSSGSFDNINYTRFKKNEMFPAFANASNDDNFGQNDPDTVDTATENDSLYLRCDSAGNMNAQIDWVSSLNPIASLPGSFNALVDKDDTLAISFTTSKIKTTVDITPRRIQRFSVAAGYSYNWKNIDVATGNIVASGILLPDVNGLLTVNDFEINESGNRLLITKGSSVDAEDNSHVVNKLSVQALPNPFNSLTKIVAKSANYDKNQYVKLKIYTTAGKCIYRTESTMLFASNGIAWDAASLPSGIYLAVIQVGKHQTCKAINFIR